MTAAHAGRQIPWVRLVGLAWPMVPAGWRQRISPATASMVVTLGLPLAERLFGGAGGPPLATMPQVDLARFAGTWYEVARLRATSDEGDTGQAEVRYGYRGDGRFDIVERWLDAGGQPCEAIGVAEAAAESAGARLKVSASPPGLRWLPGAWRDRWFLHVDRDHTEALIGSPDRDYLRLLSRTPQLAPDRVQALVRMAHDNGFATDRLRFTGPP